MDWIVAHSEVIGTALSAAGSVWATIRFIDRRFKAHLSEIFASKADMVKLDKKLDFLTEVILDDKLVKPRGTRRTKHTS